MASVSAVKKGQVSLDEKLLEAIGIRRIQKKDGGKTKAEPEEDEEEEFDDKLEQGNDIRFFIPDMNFFTPMGRSKRGEWLSEHKEKGQTFKQFLTGSYRGPSKVHNTIYLLPVVLKEDPVPKEVMVPLVKFASIFFGMPVKQLKSCNLLGKVADRMNDGIYQAHAGEILTKMGSGKPRDAFCLAGITLTDLYPRESWNFVFGLAISTGNCGIYSIARYLSNFGDNECSQIDLERDPLSTILVRACKTMCHEIGHVFGLRHCIHFKCLMNGSNHLKESDSRPNFLCPICLRKLHYVCKFDIVERYKAMREFWEEHRLPEQIDWLERRLTSLQVK